MDVLPDEIVRHIFEYLSFDEVSKTRQCCKRFNSVGGQVLNDGFRKVRSFHSRCLREIKDELPRRESERRKHELYPRHDVLQAIETRLSLLCMTYSRLIGNGRICFIPGKVLDELYRVLRIIRKYEIPVPNSVILLQEMRDISSMAMEHFDENILPTVEGNEIKKPLFACLASNSQPAPTSGISDLTPLDLLGRVSKPVKRSHHVTTVFGLRDKISSQGRSIRQLKNKIKHLENITTSQSLTITEQKGHISEIVKQLEVVQERLGISCVIRPTSESDPGTSKDINNNSNSNLMRSEPKPGEKRTSNNKNVSSFLKKRKY